MTEGNYLKINDLVQFRFLDPQLLKIKDDYSSTPGTGMVALGGQPLSSKKGLMVRIAATHAGIITGNNTFYLPDRVRDGVPTFLENYSKPVLLHHGETNDPIGRIVQAKYVDTSKIVQDKYRGKEVRDSIGKTLGTINDQLIKDFCDGKMPYSMQVDVIRNIFDTGMLQDPQYEGLGFAEIVAHITDEAAIPKFLDGRYLTGSVAATTDKATCSICKQDWTKEGPCSDKPGSIKDGKKVYLIAGNFKYGEYSMVNKPADRHSKVLELYYNGIKDSIEVPTDSGGRIYEVSLGFPQYDATTTEETLMKDKENQVKVQDSQNEIVPPVAEKKVDQIIDPSSQTEGTTEIKNTESFDDFFTRLIDIEKPITDDDREKVYQLMLDEMKAFGLTDQEIIDAKLSTEKRKKLAGSTFCGPNKSFPVPDCAHVTAARRLIGRFKGDKAGILSCVSRKAKAMGCDSSKTKDTDTTKVNVKDDIHTGCASMLRSVLGVLESNQWSKGPDEEEYVLTPEEESMLTEIIKRLAGDLGKDSIQKVSSVLKLGLDSVTEKTFIDEITVLEETIGTLRDEQVQLTEQRDALKEEYDTLFKEMNALQDSVVETKTKSRQAKLSNLNLLSNLKGGAIVDSEKLALLTDEVIDSELTKLSAEVDMKKITDKLNDGMSRIPTGEVKNPAAAVIQDNSGNENSKSEYQIIMDNWSKLKVNDKVQAEQYKNRELERLRREGKIKASKPNVKHSK